MVLRFGDKIEDLYILEAVGDQGVRLIKWLSVRVFLGGFFNQIGFRKLLYELTP
jgi:hypothetical protein